MSLVRPLFLCVCLGIPSVYLASPGVAQEKQAAKEKEEPEKRRLRKAHEILELMDQRQISEKAMGVQLEVSGVPKEFAEKFIQHFNFDELIDKTAELYAKHLEEADLDAQIAFYKSDAGKHIAAALPELTIETIKVGAELGKRAAEEVSSGK